MFLANNLILGFSIVNILMLFSSNKTSILVVCSANSNLWLKYLVKTFNSFVSKFKEWFKQNNATKAGNISNPRISLILISWIYLLNPSGATLSLFEKSNLCLAKLRLSNTDEPSPLFSLISVWSTSVPVLSMVGRKAYMQSVIIF